MVRRTLIAVILLGAVTTASAQTNGYTKADTQIKITGRDAIDPPSDQPKDRAAFFITGDGAKKLYDAIPNKAESACSGMAKNSGGLSCYRGGTRYVCMFAVILTTGELKQYGAC